MDITETLAPNSDQLDAIELAAGPRTFRVKEVSRGNAEQPVNVHFHDFPRPWRPSKGMRRVLAACWGADASQWAGRQVTLYLDPEVTFGKEKPGGTRIAALSHIDGPKRIPLLVARGKSATFTVQPLTAAAPAPQVDPLAVAKAALWAAWQASGGGDAAALADAYAEYTGQPLKDATPADLDAYCDALAQDALKADAAEGGGGQ